MSALGDLSSFYFSLNIFYNALQQTILKFSVLCLSIGIKETISNGALGNVNILETK